MVLLNKLLGLPYGMIARLCRELLGRDWSGTLVHDGWSVYNRLTRRLVNNASAICSDAVDNRSICRDGRPAVANNSSRGAVRLPRATLAIG